MRLHSACMESKSGSSTSSEATPTRRGTTSESPMMSERAFTGTTTGRRATPFHTGRGRSYVSIEFPSEQKAVAFEKYLKSGSGRAFAKRHFAA